MHRPTYRASLLMLSLAAMPQAAGAADFGFVRWPSYLDMPITWALLVTGVSFVVFKTQMPKGTKDFVSVPKDKRSMLLKLSAILMLASLMACLGMVFVGMGLQRAIER